MITGVPKPATRNALYIWAQIVSTLTCSAGVVSFVPPFNAHPKNAGMLGEGQQQKTLYFSCGSGSFPALRRLLLQADKCAARYLQGGVDGDVLIQAGRRPTYF